MSTIIDDLRFARRALRKRPGFVAAAVLTLALGIGANTAIFSVINAFMLKPLPYPDGERLVEVHNTYPGIGLENAGTSIPDYLDRREQADALEDLALFTWNSFNLASDGPPERLRGLTATPSLFSTLRVAPFLGRAFGDDEAVIGNDKVVVLGHPVWMNRFNGDPGIVGREIRLNGESYRVLGVMPQGFAFPDRNVDVYVPFAFTPEQVSDQSRGHEFSASIGRLKPGATIEQLNAQMDAIVRSNRDRFVASGAAQGTEYAEALERIGFTGRAQSWREFLVGDVSGTLLVLQGVVVLVLLIACANVANLMLARVLARARELAVRTAVGAERRRVSRQLVLEGVLLGLGGGLLGLFLSFVVIRLIEVFGIDRSSQNFDIAIDGQVLAFAFVVSIAAGVLFSLVSVAALWRMDVQRVIKEGGKQTASRRTLLVRGVLVSMQVALAATLLVGAGLLLRSFDALLSESPGFDPDDVIGLQMELSGARYGDPDQRRAFLDEVLARVRAQPGIVSASLVAALPFTAGAPQGSYVIEGHTPAPGEGDPHGYAQVVSEDYFETLHIPLLAGRNFDPELDGVRSPHAVIIDRLLADRYFPNADPIGRTLANLTPTGETMPATIIGVVGTIKRERLDETPSKETYYHYYRQRPPAWASLVVRTELPVATATRQVASAVQAVDPEQPVFNVMTMNERIERSLGESRAPTLLLSVFAGVAVLLAVVGIYGVLTYAVGQRTTELGVRMALGAQATNVIGLVVGQGAWLVGGGLVLGLVGALALTRFLSSLLFGVSAFDPFTYAGVALLLAAVGMSACSLPALRATRVSPVAALRHE